MNTKKRMALFVFLVLFLGTANNIREKIENVNGSDAEIIENQETKRLEDDFLQ